MKKITVYAPATVGNVSCGFDAMGFAVEAPGDTVSIELTDTDFIEMKEIKPSHLALPRNAKTNTAGVAVQSYLNSLGKQVGLTISLEKGLPIGSGMGSSAASAVAAVVAVNHLLGCPLRELELIPHAMEAERIACGSAHADNVAPCLLGGFTLVRSYQPLDVVKIPLKAELWCTLVHPHFEVKTKDARAVLPPVVPLEHAVAQAAHTASLVAGLMQPDYVLIGNSLQDWIAEPVRAPLIPDFYELKKDAVGAGALGSGISGSGPTLFSLSQSKAAAARVGEAMRQRFAKRAINCDVHVSLINDDGAKVIS